MYGEDFELRKGTLVIEEGIIKGWTYEHDDEVVDKTIKAMENVFKNL